MRIYQITMSLTQHPRLSRPPLIRSNSTITRYRNLLTIVHRRRRHSTGTTLSITCLTARTRTRINIRITRQLIGRGSLKPRRRQTHRNRTLTLPTQSIYRTHIHLILRTRNIGRLTNTLLNLNATSTNLTRTMNRITHGHRIQRRHMKLRRH